MLEKTKRQFWNLNQIPHRTKQSDFRFLIFFSFLFLFRVPLVFFLTFDLQFKKIWDEYWKSLCIVLCGIRFSFQTCFFFSSIDNFWLVFFWRLKNTFCKSQIYIYICTYWVLLRGFDAINASNQRTICSCMIFKPSCFILYFIFSINSAISMKFSIMMSPRYNDFTHFHQFWWKLHSICKIEFEDLFVRGTFLIFGIFIEKITIYYENPVYCCYPTPLSHPLWAAY